MLPHPSVTHLGSSRHSTLQAEGTHFLISLQMDVLFLWSEPVSPAAWGQNPAPAALLEKAALAGLLRGSPGGRMNPDPAAGGLCGQGHRKGGDYMG